MADPTPATAPVEQTWATSFVRVHGRAPRVLHIGNISNNAYRNAKLMRSEGVDSDVLCYDYYHAMGCPEWDDADFDENVEDMFAPRWSAMNLRSFVRPEWFVQGPLNDAVQYLDARRRGQYGRARQHAEILALFSRVPSSDGGRRPTWRENARMIYRRSFAALVRGLYRAHLLPYVRRVMAPYRRVQWRTRYPEDRDWFTAHSANLIERFNQAFPDRKDRLVENDFCPYYMLLNWFRSLAENYDIIQGYSTDPIWPMLVGVPYFAFEHGTLREIPFEPSPRGRLTALAYHLAEHVFVTNADCLDNAHQLAGDSVTFINHPYDESRGLAEEGVADLRREWQRRTESEILIFFPTRQDWVVSRFGYADKGNDVMIRGFARLRQAGFRIGMVCCSWGHDVRASQSLIAKLGCASWVHWVPPMGMVQFHRAARACEIVADQFKLGAFGGVFFSSLCSAAPVCCYLNEDAMRRAYGEVPPVLNCRTDDDVVGKLSAALADPGSLQAIGRQGREWIERNHAGRRTAWTQMRQYELFLERRDAKRPEEAMSATKAR